MSEEKAITVEGAMRAALESVRKVIAGLFDITNSMGDDTTLYISVLEKIDAALAMKAPETYHTRYSEGFNAGYRNGLNDGKRISEQVISNAQPYELSTKVGAEMDSKGTLKPNAEVRISRRLETVDDLDILIKADILHGVEEVMAAVQEVQKRNVGVR